MAFIAKSSIQEVTDKMDAVAVVGDYVRLSAQSGGRYIGLCPFHHEKSPSFSVDAEKKLYYCFGCHKGGTVIGFLMEMDKLSFLEAVETLAQRFGVPLVYEQQSGGEAAEAAARKNEELFELYRRVAGTYLHLLTESPQGREAKEYLLSRSISAGMIERFRLGYAPRDRRWLFRFLTQKGYSAGFLAASGLFSQNYPQVSFFSDRIIFPIADRRGRTVAFGGRLIPGSPLPGNPAPGEGGPKYLNSRESEVYRKGQTLFAVDLAQAEIRKTGEAYLAEGYLDVIALHQAGLVNAVAPLGTSFTDEQAKLLRRWAARVYLFLDADPAGQNALVTAILTCRRNGLEAAVVVPGQGEAGGLPAGEGVPKDPAEILQKFGPGTLQKAAKCFILDFDYLLSRCKGLFDLSSGEGKARAVSFLFPYAETLDSQVSREACLASVADAVGVDRAAVWYDYGRYETDRKTGGTGANFRKEAIPPPSAPVRMNDELSLLVAIAVNQSRYPALRKTLSIKEIEDPAAKELFIALEECFAHDESGMDDLLSRVPSEALRNFVIGRGASKEFSVSAGQLDRLISDGVKKVRRKGLERRLRDIDLRLRTLGADRNGENGGMEELLNEKMELRAELSRLEPRQVF
jgi:DNA primase